MRTHADWPEFNAFFDPQAFTSLVEAQWRWASQVMELQAAWFGACCQLQAQALQAPQWPPQGEWPSWLVWHNGTEQLA